MTLNIVINEIATPFGWSPVKDDFAHPSLL